MKNINQLKIILSCLRMLILKHSLICFRSATRVDFDKRTYSLKDDWLPNFE